MKADIHPDYVVATVKCSCGNTYTTRSTTSGMVSPARRWTKHSFSCPRGQRRSVSARSFSSGRIQGATARQYSASQSLTARQSAYAGSRSTTPCTINP